jgi:putative transposase
MARVVCPGFPHHITQRGVRRFNVFLDEADHILYRELLDHYARRHGLGLASYCLMTIHVHVIGIPEHKNSIARALGECHGAYAAEFNKKYRKSGHVWQLRPYSCVLDDAHAWAAVRYVERNPLRAGMVDRAEEYPWSSARAPLRHGDRFPADDVMAGRFIGTRLERMAGRDAGPGQRTPDSFSDLYRKALRRRRIHQAN